MSLLQFTEKGIYCAAGDFFIDPWRPVERAVITHAHADHARMGNQHYLCTHSSVPLLRLRLGADISVQGVNYEEVVRYNGVQLSLHPAGHIIGSAQVRVEYQGEVWVVSGDYKLENDGLSPQFEPVACHTFITESTFGLPIYRWLPQEELFGNMRQWIAENRQADKSSVLIGYSLGKAQRLLYHLRDVTDRFLVHGAIAVPHAVLLAEGWPLPPVERITPETPKSAFKGSVIIAPPSAVGSTWMRKLQPYSLGICSGWMQVRGNMRRSNADAGFALSDHADWPGLLEAVKATGASRVLTTHGFSSAFARHLQELGIEAGEVKTEFGQEEEEAITTPEDQTTT
ncbi:ligase-associated DNA damage response exonuclease [Chitinophaga pendula]|uniref:ligase-associated DNA damage response exonuclease n=1 Tax=Chitinophaga TaxID=79328 RepID=UPI000BB0AFD7|nr:MULTISPECIES: ligase-associated DNA damage response exonuclease [Chitinophaga]ASZ14584.1 DNA ligase-associated DEXH box helicase [Chitinophaga sp. MD30]UCJ07764.1 ligase-associated DNA damage response exonuclease [Chitinophaga pendula]